MLASSFELATWNFRLILNGWMCVSVWPRSARGKHDKWYSIEWNTIWPLAPFQCKCLAMCNVSWARFSHPFADNLLIHSFIQQAQYHCRNVCMPFHHVSYSLIDNNNNFIDIYAQYATVHSPLFCIRCARFSCSCLLKNSLQVLSFASLCGSLWNMHKKKFSTSKLQLAHISAANDDCRICICSSN